MAAQRYISTSFWDDAWIQSLEPEQKFIYMYLLTNSLTNIAGVYKITMRRISFDTGLDMSSVEKILNDFKKDGKAYLLDQEWMVLPNWPKHQKWSERSKVRDGIVSELQDLPDHILEQLTDIDYSFDLNLVESTVIASKQRTSISGSTRKKVIDRAEGCCEICGSSDVKLVIHHKKSLKDGGDNSIENLSAICESCHVNTHSPDRIYRLETQSKKVPNYIDSDSDSDIDLDSDIDSDSDADSRDESDGSLVDNFVEQMNGILKNKIDLSTHGKMLLSKVPPDKMSDLHLAITESSWIIKNGSLAFVAKNWRKILKGQYKDFKQKGPPVDPHEDERIAERFRRRT